MLGWSTPASPGVEFKGFTVVNASYTTARWALTYTPQPVRVPLRHAHPCIDGCALPWHHIGECIISYVRVMRAGSHAYSGG